MYTFLLVLLILDSAVLVAAVLLQSGKGGGVAASFGGVSSSTDAFIGTRQAGNLLTTVTWWTGGIFLGLSFILQLMSTHARAPTSVLDKTFGRPAPTAPPVQQSVPAVPLQPTQPAQPAPPKK
jgi:preprotein translocase subunit SecG